MESMDNFRERVESQEHHARTTEDRMRRLTVVLTVVLALWTGFQTPEAAAQNLITACQTISQPGAYALANNLTASGDCLVITTDFVTIDLAGFVITGNSTGSGITVPPVIGVVRGIAVRNGSIRDFVNGVDLSVVDGSIVEELRVFDNGRNGIWAFGIARSNTVQNNGGFGILVRGTVTGNYVAENQIGLLGGEGSTVSGNTAIRNSLQGIGAGAGSTVTGNTAVDNREFGIIVACPSNVIGNTATNNPSGNLVLNGQGCNSINNLAP
jgi:hypothetical protein